MTPRMRSGQQPSGKSDWETPDGLMAALRAEFGGFGLDPCATKATSKAIDYCGPDNGENGLLLAWSGYRNVYCNPPYGRGIGQWVQKCENEAWLGHTGLVVALLPVATDTYWWQTWVSLATEVRFLKGRIRFKGAAGPAPFASAIVIWRRGMLGWHRVSYWDWKAKA